VPKDDLHILAGPLLQLKPWSVTVRLTAGGAFAGEIQLAGLAAEAYARKTVHNKAYSVPAFEMFGPLVRLVAIQVVEKLGALVAMTGLEGSALTGYLATQMDSIQAISFMLFILLYVPCLSTLATQLNESRSWKFTAISLGWSLGLAWVVSFSFYQGARLLGY